MEFTDETEFAVCHHNHLHSPFFEQVKEGKKISECKINKKGNIYHEGQIMRFYNEGSDEIDVRIVGVSHYSNFEEMLHNEMKNLLPEVESFEEGLDFYRKKYHNKAEEERLGVIVIHIEVI